MTSFTMSTDDNQQFSDSNALGLFHLTTLKANGETRSLKSYSTFEDTSITCQEKFTDQFGWKECIYPGKRYSADVGGGFICGFYGRVNKPDSSGYRQQIIHALALVFLLPVRRAASD